MGDGDVGVLGSNDGIWRWMGMGRLRLRLELLMDLACSSD
jgi:hypothetical protein